MLLGSRGCWTAATNINEGVDLSLGAGFRSGTLGYRSHNEIVARVDPNLRGLGADFAILLKVVQVRSSSWRVGTADLSV